LSRLEERFNSFLTIHHYTQASEIQTSVKSLIHQELHSLDVALRRKSIQIQAQMDKTIDTLLKEVYAAANDGHDAMSKAYATMAEELADTMLKIQQSTTGINDFIPYVPFRLTDTILRAFAHAELSTSDFAAPCY
jgi:hypothetical protein